MKMKKKTRGAEVAKWYELYRDHGYTLRSLEPVAGVSYGQIRNLFTKYGFDLRNPSRIPSIVTDKLQSITTPEDAYWYGFLSCDSSINRNTLSIVLKHSDKTHLDKLQSYLGTQYKYNHNKRTGCIGFSLPVTAIYDRIAANGLLEGKHNRFVPDLSGNLADHYWRGAFDADGGVYTKDYRISFTGPERFVSGFRKWLNIRKSGGYAGAYYQRSNGLSWEYKIGGVKQISLLYDRIYGSGGVCLDRKQSMFEMRVTMAKIYLDK